MISAFITDDCIEKSYIKAVNRMHPECRFEFRPILAEDRAEFIHRIGKEEDAKRAERIAGKALADHLVSWSLGDDVSPARIMKLKPSLLARLVTIVLYADDPGDDDPTATDDGEESDETTSFSASN